MCQLVLVLLYSSRLQYNYVAINSLIVGKYIWTVFHMHAIGLLSVMHSRYLKQLGERCGTNCLTGHTQHMRL